MAISGTVLVSVTYGLQTGVGFLLAYSRSAWIWEHAQDPQILRFMLQYGALAMAAYGIIKYLNGNPLVAASGLLVAPAAVILEITYEIVYGA